MTALLAGLARRWARCWLTGPLRAADVIHLAGRGEYELCLIRHRKRGND